MHDGFKILDVGCATGVNSERIKALGHQVVGIDYSPIAIEKYKALGFEGLAANILDSFPNSWCKTFDVVFALDILEHLESPEQALLNINKVQKIQS